MGVTSILSKFVYLSISYSGMPDKRVFGKNGRLIIFLVEILKVINQNGEFQSISRRTPAYLGAPKERGRWISMKAVIMAGGEGTRLRPMSLGMPKPMTPLFGRPVMEHIIALLKRHGVTDICVTLCYKPELVMDHFGDGGALGVRLTYFVEEKPLGTAGSVKACARQLGEEDFLVVSGDAVCDFDLSGAIEFHRERKAAATLLLTPRESPLEYGLVVTDGEGKILRFIEKPSWGQVVTNMVNTGIYILSPEAMRAVPEGQGFDFGRDLFPELLEQGSGLYGCDGRGYWCDMGDCGAYLQCTADALEGRVSLDLGLPELRPGVWSAGPIPEGVTAVAPCWLGPDVTLRPGAQVGPCAVLDRGAEAGARSVIRRSVLLPGAKAGEKASLYGAILCPGAVAEREAVLNEGAVLGENALAEEGSVLLEGVGLWPGLTAPARCRLAQSVTSGAQRPAVRFSDGGVITGTLGEDLGPEALMAIGSALGAEKQVGLGYWGGPGAQMLAQAAASGSSAAGAAVLRHDMETPAQAAWLSRRCSLPVSLYIQQEGERVYLHFFGSDGLSLGRERERKLEHALLKGESPRVGAGRVGEFLRAQLTPGEYAADAARQGGLRRGAMHTVTAAATGKSPADRSLRQSLSLLGCGVAEEWRKGIPAFWARRGGFYLAARDERGTELEPEQLLPLICMIELENGSGEVAVPDGASAAVDLVCAGLGGQALRLGRDGQRAREIYAAQPWLRDAAFAAARICARMSMTGESLEALMRKTPRFSARKREIPLSADRGKVMRELAREHSRDMEGEGLRIRTGNGWVYLVPLARRRALRVVAESADMELADELCDFYAGRCARADRAALGQDTQQGPGN